MAKITDSFGTIKPSELAKFFSTYNNAGALESAFTSSPSINAAASNFNANRRTPGMAEAPIEGIAPTDLSATQVRKLEPTPWLVSMQGEGPRYQQTPPSFKSLLERQEIQQALRDRQQEQVNLFMKSHPIEFAGVPEGVFENIAQAMKFYSDKKAEPGKKLAEQGRALENEIKKAKLKGGGAGWKLDATGGAIGTKTKTAADVLGKFGL